MLKLIFLMLAAHELCDGPLKTEFMTRAKNRHVSPFLEWMPWQYALYGHSIIHGGAVCLITGSVWLGIAETAVHFLTDAAKSEKFISPRVDGAIHILSKVLWASIITMQF